MGGAVSSGESNDELIDNLLESDYIKTAKVERIFRAVDRALYYTEAYKSNAYKDLAWKDGNLHLSAPCIYSVVLENIKLEQGLSFLNMGSGTGYLSTMCGLIIGKNGVNHGIELHAEVAEYAREKLEEFVRTSPAVDGFDFCHPEFVVGNCLDPISSHNKYDRIYCGAACPEESIRNVTDLLKIGGICVMPINDSLVQITRISEGSDERKSLLPVSFATLIAPRSGIEKKPVVLPALNPLSLKELCRIEIRGLIRNGFMSPGSGPLGMDGERKKRRRKRHPARQDHRRGANRVLVVQRRRSGGDEAETGFVAVAYSLGNSSSEDDNRREYNHDDMNGSSSTSDDQLPDLEEPSLAAGGPLSSSLPNPPPPASTNTTAPLRPSGQNRGILNRARISIQQQNNTVRGEGNNETGPGRVVGNPSANDTFLRRIRELYRRREQRAGFRQLSGLFNTVSSAATSVLVRSSPNSSPQTNETSENQRANNTTGHPTATATTSSGTRRRPEPSGSSTNNDDSCIWSSDSSMESSSAAMSSSNSNSSEEDDENKDNGRRANFSNNLRAKTNHRISASGESGVVTDSPERKDDDMLDEDAVPSNGGTSAENNKKGKKNRNMKKRKKVDNHKSVGNPPPPEFEDSMDIEDDDDDNSATGKLKRNPISVQMRTRINQLPLIPPPVKTYLNLNRQIDSMID